MANPETSPELLAATPSDTLRKLRAQIIAGDVTDRLAAITTLVTTLIDKEIVHEARLDRDKKADQEAKEVYARAAAAVAKAAQAEQDKAEADTAAHSTSAGRSSASATARR